MISSVLKSVMAVVNSFIPNHPISNKVRITSVEHLQIGNSYSVNSEEIKRMRQCKRRGKSQILLVEKDKTEPSEKG